MHFSTSILFFCRRQTARRFSLVLHCLSFSLQLAAASAAAVGDGVCVRPAARHMCRSLCVPVCVNVRSPYKLSPPKSIRSSLNLATQANTSNFWNE